MSITLIQNANLGDAKKALGELLTNGVRSPDVRSLALNIVADTNDAVAAVYDWVQANVSYVHDPYGRELFTAPIKMVQKYQNGERLAEDCDGVSLITAALLSSIGLPTRIVLADTGFRGHIDHAYAEVYSDKLNDWISVDATPTSSGAVFPLGWIIRAKSRTYVYPG